MKILLLLLLSLLFFNQIQGQTPIPTTTTIILYNTSSTTNEPTATVTVTKSTISNTTTTMNNTGSIPFFSPSPTSFVFTHFPIFPFHTASSSSLMSSARPSQSAPFPDDTIGKYGRLHISKATTIKYIPCYYFLFIFTLFLLE